MKSTEAFPSRVTAATVVAVGLIFWLPYLTFPIGTPMVNPLWGLIFGVAPALVSLITSSSGTTFVTALLWPVIVTVLAGVYLGRAAPGPSRVAHVLVWASLVAIIPIDLANTFHLFTSVGIYRFFSI